jgi:hypothetical protein
MPTRIALPPSALTDVGVLAGRLSDLTGEGAFVGRLADLADWRAAFVTGGFVRTVGRFAFGERILRGVAILPGLLDHAATSGASVRWAADGGCRTPSRASRLRT